MTELSTLVELLLKLEVQEVRGLPVVLSVENGVAVTEIRMGLITKVKLGTAEKRPVGTLITYLADHIEQMHERRAKHEARPLKENVKLSREQQEKRQALRELLKLHQKVQRAELKLKETRREARL